LPSLGFAEAQRVENRPGLNLRKDSSSAADSGQSTGITQESLVRRFLQFVQSA